MYPDYQICSGFSLISGYPTKPVIMDGDSGIELHYISAVLALRTANLVYPTVHTYRSTQDNSFIGGFVSDHVDCMFCL
jgi:hypothetical protein